MKAFPDHFSSDYNLPISNYMNSSQTTLSKKTSHLSMGSLSEKITSVASRLKNRSVKLDNETRKINPSNRHNAVLNGSISNLSKKCLNYESNANEHALEQGIRFAVADEIPYPSIKQQIVMLKKFCAGADRKLEQVKKQKSAIIERANTLTGIERQNAKSDIHNLERMEKALESKISILEAQIKELTKAKNEIQLNQRKIDKIARHYIINKKAPKAEDKSKFREAVLEQIKTNLLNDKFEVTLPDGSKGKGGIIKKLKGGSGGVYALGLQVKPLHSQKEHFIPILVAKFTNEEPGGRHGLQESDPKVLSAILDPTDENIEAAGGKQEIIRIGIPPGKGTIHEYIVHSSALGNNCSAMTTIAHPTLNYKTKSPESNEVIEVPQYPKNCVIEGFISNKGDLYNLSRVSSLDINEENKKKQALEAEIKELDKINDFDQKEEFLLLKKEKLNEIKEIKKDIALIEKSMQLGFFNKQVAEAQGLKHCDKESLKALMMLDIIYENSDSKQQNMLLSQEKGGKRKIAIVDYGAILSRLHEMPSDAMPEWSKFTGKSCANPVADFVIGKDPKMAKLIKDYDIDKEISRMQTLMEFNGAKLEQVTIDRFRARLLFLKYAVDQKMTYADVAKVVFENTFDEKPQNVQYRLPNGDSQENRFHNRIHKAVELCEKAMQSDGIPKELQKELMSTYLEKFILAGFMNSNICDLAKISLK